MDEEQQIASADRESSPSTPSKANDITLIPYAMVDGEWNLPDHFLRFIFKGIQQDETSKRLFYDGAVKTGDQFISTMQNPNNLPAFLLDGTTCLGFGWLNGLADNYAYAHFCYRRFAWKQAIELGQTLTNYWFSFSGEDGPLFDLLLGIIPEFNKPAIQYIKKLGWHRVGVIPGMLKCDYQDGRASAIICYISRFDNGQEQKPATRSESCA